MSNLRLIPRLDVKGPNLVKGIHLEGLRVMGDPQKFAQRYYEEGADELITMDVVASLYGRNNLLDIVRRTAEHIFIPLTVGGGIRTLEDIKNLLRAGADKVAINTAALKNPSLIQEAAATFGSQCIVLSIEAKKMPDGNYEAFSDNGRERSGKNVLEWVRQGIEMGAGEILLTSIDQEGTGCGYDIDLISKISSIVSIPLIVCGGAGSCDDFLDVIRYGPVDALCASSIFHYKKLERYRDMNTVEQEGNIEFISQNRGDLGFMSDRIVPATLPEVKNFLRQSGIFCRWAQA